MIIAVLAIAAAAWLFVQREKTRKLRHRFGPEYDRALDEEKSANRAEAVLTERQRRVEKYSIRRLTPEERDEFNAKWRVVQEHFVDSPHEAVGQADALVIDAMRTRGYPMSEFEQRSADLSVDHPMVVSDYRVAHEIAERDSRSEASTEDLRKAMQHYRRLFEHLLESHVLQHR